MRGSTLLSFALLQAGLGGALATGVGPVAGAGAARTDAPQVLEDRYPRAAASYLVQIDGRLVWGREIDARRPPASLVKLLTALVALEDGLDPGRVVRVSERAARQTAAKLAFRPGEGMTAGQLLDAALIASANDAAEALGEDRAGPQAFVDRMNARARRLGLTRTHFSNPTGLDARGQVSTARDLLALAQEALVHPEIAARVALPGATLTTSSGRRIHVASTNTLLGRVPGVRGIKTGTTARAGECLIAIAERDGHRVLVVLLGAKDRWWTGAALVEAAFREAGVARVDSAGEGTAAAAPGAPSGDELGGGAPPPP